MTPCPAWTTQVPSPTEILRAIVYPATSGVVLAAVVVFGILLAIASMAGLLGLWLLIVVIPALVRFHVIVLEARSQNLDPQPPGIEFFTLVGNAWTLFPVVHVALCVAGVVVLRDAFGYAGVAAFGLAVALIYPASLIVLALTRSPLECINPLAIASLMERVGFGYIVLPLYLAAASAVAVVIEKELPALPGLFIDLLLSFSFVSLAGSVIAPFELQKEVEIAEPVEKSADDVAADLLKQRTRILNHAYGFISRDNRAGGLGHILDWIGRDPEPDTAWTWFFEQMLAWERNEAALFFAQRYLSRLLQAGDRIAAVKVMMRCRLVNDSFKPFDEEIDLAIDAAHACNNAELASILESSARR